MLCRLVCLVLLAAMPVNADGPRQPLKDLNGDPLPKGAIARFGSVRIVHNSQKHTFSPNGKLLASKGYSQVRVWYLADGREVCRVDNRVPYESWAVALLSDGLLVADDAEVRVVDFATLKTVRVLERAKRKNPQLIVTADGKRVAVASDDKGLVLYDLTAREGAAPQQICKVSPWSFALSWGGEILAGYWSDTIEVWNTRTRKKLCAIKYAWGQGGNLDLSPDGIRLATLQDNKVCLWSTLDGRPVKGFKPPNLTIYHVHFSADGKTLMAVDGEGQIHDLSVASGASSAVRKSPPITWSGLHAEAQLLAGFARGDQISVWDLQRGKPYLDPDRFPPLKHVWCVRPGVAACQSCDGALLFWRTKDGKLLSRNDRLPRYAETALSPDGKLLAAVRQDMRTTHLICYEVGTGKPVRRLVEGGKLIAWGSEPSFSPDGRILATSAWRETPHCLWDLATGRLLRTLTIDRTVEQYNGAAAFSPDCRLVVVANERSLDLIEVATGKMRSRIKIPLLGASEKKPPAHCTIAFSRNGRSLVAWGSCAVASISVPERKVTSQHDSDLAALSPDGRWLATRSGEERDHVCIFDLFSSNTARGAALFCGHTGYVTGLAFSADGRQLVSCGEDGTALVWDMEAIHARASKPAARPQKNSRPRARDGQLATWFNTLGSDDAEKADAAMAGLEREPDRAVALLAARLSPVTGPPAEKIRELVRGLDSRRFADRERATHELERLGELAEPELDNLLRTDLLPETSLRIRRILDNLNRDLDADQRRGLRAVELLERIGSGNARTLLEKLSKGHPGATLTREAKKALTR